MYYLAVTITGNLRDIELVQICTAIKIVFDAVVYVPKTDFENNKEILSHNAAFSDVI